MSDLVFRLPDLGEGVADAKILDVMIKANGGVIEGDPIFEVLTDKATVEIPSPVTGTVFRVHVKIDQEVKAGDKLVTFIHPSSIYDMPAYRVRVAMINVDSIDPEGMNMRVQRSGASVADLKEMIIDIVGHLRRFRGRFTDKLNRYSINDLEQALFRWWSMVVEIRRLPDLKLSSGEAIEFAQRLSRNLPELVQSFKRTYEVMGAPRVLIASPVGDINISEELKSHFGSGARVALWVNDSVLSSSDSSVDGVIEAVRRYDYVVIVISEIRSVHFSGSAMGPLMVACGIFWISCALSGCSERFSCLTPTSWSRAFEGSSLSTPSPSTPLAVGGAERRRRGRGYEGLGRRS